MERKAIQREWSGASPPPGTTQWMCGWGVSVLSPGMQDGQEAKLCAETLGIGSDIEQRGRTGLEEQGKQRPLVLPHQRHQHMRHAEDQVVVADVQQFLLSLPQPLIARTSLAFRAVPVAAGVIRDGLVSAVGARVTMSAERSGTAATIASSTLRCGQVSEALYRCRKLSPLMRMMSATSKGGRLIASCPAVLCEARSAPAG